jgi:hypothetical protein
LAAENLLKKLRGIENICEVAEIINTFTLTRKSKGKEQEVIVQILDRGETVDRNYRYQCLVKTVDGYATVGNFDSSPEYAIGRVHWEHLDRNSNKFYKDIKIERG